ncbi:MAG: ferredoxin--NADP reductase [Hyphomicrobiaceae bacterium]|nr:ferredoxin--NADP reductase [Hyphomicrobiaceae bacterium]
MVSFNHETVLGVQHWTNTLFSFTTTRNPAFRFENGQFAMIGVKCNSTPLVRAYSMVSPNYTEQLEWLSIKVPDGPLTSRLQSVKVGDTILVSKKPFGTLVIDNLSPGRRLYLLSTGTGLAPFMSIIGDPITYERFGSVVLVHSCRYVAELAYAKRIKEELPNHEFLGELIKQKLIYFPTVTREPFENTGRITDIVACGELFEKIAMPSLDPSVDRVMLCGNPNFIVDMRTILEAFSFREGSSNNPAEYLVEKAFAER